MKIYKRNSNKVYVHYRDRVQHELVEHTRTNVQHTRFQHIFSY